MKNKILFQCPCCDYYTLSERFWYIICPVCFWEDDWIDINNLDEISSPNNITLREWRLNFTKYWACDINMKKNVIPIIERNKYKYIFRDINNKN